MVHIRLFCFYIPARQVPFPLEAYERCFFLNLSIQL